VRVSALGHDLHQEHDIESKGHTMTTRLKAFASAASLLAMMAVSTATMAQSAGAQTLRWIVPYPPGGGSDVTARIVADALKQDLGNAVIVENKPGAGTLIGMQALMASAPDAMTVATADSGTLAFNPSLYSKLPYKIDSSFSYVGGIGRLPLVLVARKGLAAKSVKDLIALAKAEPGKLTYASAGPGSPHHIAMEMFQQQTGVRFLHVPYKGAAPAVQDLLAGQVDLMLLDMPGGISFMKADKFVLMGVAMPRRVVQLPDVPTLSEAGVPDFVAFAWQGMVAPAGTPTNLIDKLDAALRKALSSPLVRGKLEDIGVEPMPMDGKAFANYAAAEQKRWDKVIKAADVKLD
jgi:tripartite-type tricarboxylate transporter receptor subunit TctC